MSSTSLPGTAAGVPTLHVRTGDPTPPYEQLRRQLAAMISTGVLRVDARLPPLRQLAGDLGLAVGTVARTYRELEQEGLVVTRRGGGTRVRHDAAGPSAGLQALDRQVAALLDQAELLGVDGDDVRAALERGLALRAGRD